MTEPNCEIPTEQVSAWFWTLFGGRVRFLKANKEGDCYWRIPELDGMLFPGPGLPLLNTLFYTQKEAYVEAVKRANERIYNLEEELSDQRAGLERLLIESKHEKKF